MHVYEKKKKRCRKNIFIIPNEEIVFKKKGKKASVKFETTQNNNNADYK